jgi:hypothetical protein
MENEEKNHQNQSNTPICCGVLEKMNINWMALEDGTKIMPYIEDKNNDTNWRVNNCPSCGAYVRNSTIKNEVIVGNIFD